MTKRAHATSQSRYLPSVREFRTIALLLLAACGGGDGTTAPVPVASVSVTLASSSLVVGGNTSATASARDAQGTVLTGRSASWSSSNDAVASVSSSGQVTAVSPGTADIRATIEGRTGQATVTVTPVPVSTVVVSIVAATIAAGESTQASASVRDAQGSELSGRPVTWSTSNPSIASVSATGLVTGIAAGAASIVATSEGRTGQVGVTVSASVSIASFSLRTSTGAIVDTSNVAGAIEVSADIELPTGFRGVRILRVDTVIFARDSVFGPATRAAPTFRATSFAVLSQAARTAPFSRVIQTTTATSVITADELKSTALLSNGRHVLDLSIIGQVGTGPTITRGVQTPIHTQNANVLRLFTRPERSVVLSNGRVIDAGTTTARLDYISFDGVLISEVEIVRAPAQGEYDASAIAGVVSLMTLTSPDLFREFSLPQANFESGDGGTRYLLDRVRFGSSEDRPRINPITLGGNRPSIDGSGWATPFGAASGIVLPAGIGYQETAPFPLELLPAGYIEASSSVRFIDNLAPRASAGLIAPYDRPLTINLRALLPNGSTGMSHNYLGAGAGFGDLLHADKFEPDLSGLPDAGDFEWYSGLSLSSLFTPGNRVLDFSALPAGSSRVRYVGARAADGAGNFGEWIATTTAGNPYTTGGQPAPVNLIGTAPALFGKLGAAATLDRLGVRSARVYNAQAVAASSYSFEASGSVFTGNGAYGFLFDYFDRTRCFRGFDACTTPAVLGGTFNSTTGLFTYSDPLSSMINARIASVGGTGDGVYAARYFAADASGTPAIWDGNRTGWWGGLVDRTAPSVSGSVTVNSPTDVTYSLTGEDALGVESLYAGIRFDFNNSLFPTGKLVAWIDRYEVTGDLTAGLETSASTTLTGQPYTHGGFFNLGSGSVSGPLFKVLGGGVQSRDWAFNYSNFLSIDVPNPYPEPAIPSGTTYQFSTSASSVCRDVKCPAGQSNELDYTLSVRSPLSTAPLHKASFQLVPANGGRVVHVGTDYEPVTTPVQGGFEHIYTVRWLASTACVAPALYLAKVMALSANAPLVLFNNPFIDLTVTGSSSLCTKPARPLQFTFPEF